MKYRTFIFWLGICGVLCGVLHCALGAPEGPRLTGYVQDTTIKPFIVTSDGKDLGDPFPSFWDGVWHLYSMSADAGRVVHFTSTDLVKWAEHKPAMVGKDICTASVLRHDHKYYLFYTDGAAQALRVVVSKNPWEFDFSKSQLAAEADGKVYQKGWFRDVYVTYNESEKQWWMLFEGRCPEVCTGLFKSKNLLQWTQCEPIFKDKGREYGSCPQIFKQGKLWYLAIQDCGNWYYSADTPNGPWTNRGQYLSIIVEAASRFATDGKRQIAWGWLCDWVAKPNVEIKSYGGPMCVGREMVPQANGALGVRPFPELLAAIRKKANKIDFSTVRKLSGDWKIEAAQRTLQCTGGSGGVILLDLPAKNPNCYFEAELEFGTPGTSANIVMRSSDTAERGYAFALAPADRKIAIRGFDNPVTGPVLNDKAYAFPGKNKVSLQIFICDNYMEAFVDGQQCLSVRAADRSCDKLAIAISGGPATLRNPFLHYFNNKDGK
ncbi:MAG: hypothetical protein DVB25_02680 [Verrucomicrobia bacterium]|nr:MAG: hypothetical protein DVB25_02680 [Verrucomicrobiota bacterium]